MYYKQLDSFRFFLILLVVTTHWLCGIKALENLRLGIIAVELFFVISGFLISSQLLNYKKSIEENRETFGKVLFTFYVRRSLRIFPLYYLVLIIATAFNRGEIRDAAFYNFGYASNFFFIKVQHWTATFSHFWSLSVEEHFYLVWPLVILLMKRKYLPYIFGLLALSSVIFRYNAFNGTWDFIKVYAHTFSCIDLFMLGSLLAFVYEEKKERCQKIFQAGWLRYGFPVAFGILYRVYVFRPELTTFNWVFQRFFQGIVFAIIVGFLVTGIKGKFGQVLENKYLIHFGKLSYGIYLVHNFIPGILLPVKDLQLGLPTEFAIYLITTLLTAELLHRLVEKPIRKLNKNFELKKRTKKMAPFNLNKLIVKLERPIEVFPN
jgi:peptidoglycan/LPS O-acetylase OafA/YrhL